MLLNISILLLLQHQMTTVSAFKYIPQCRFDLQYTDKDSDYRNSWQSKCFAGVEDVCKRNVVVSYFELRPFTSHRSFTRTRWPTGAVLQQIIAAALSQCCGSCMNITFNRVANRSQLTSVETRNKSDIIFPTFTQGVVNRVNITVSPVTIPLVKLSTAMFITTLQIPPKLFAIEVFRAIVDLWPLFGVALMLAFVAGVLVWFIDTWKNKAQFPRAFIAGSFEGFWWSFISMTTVGYGDIAPSSAIAKLLAMFWILCGITITGLMTAALTTAISEVSNRHKASAHHGNVGILKDHIFEKMLLMKGNAKQVYMGTINELVEGIKSREIAGMLVNTYTAKMYMRHYMQDENNKLFVRELLHDVDQSYYGVTIYEDRLYTLIHDYVNYQRDQINDYLYDTFNSLPEFKTDKIEANLLFTTQSGIYIEVLLFCVSVIAVFLIFGIIYECCRYKFKRQKVGAKKHSLAKLQIQVEEELNSMAKKWKTRFQEVESKFHVNGMFTISDSQEHYSNVTIVGKTDKVKNSKKKKKVDKKDEKKKIKKSSEKKETIKPKGKEKDKNGKKKGKMKDSKKEKPTKESPKKEKKVKFSDEMEEKENNNIKEELINNSRPLPPLMV